MAASRVAVAVSASFKWCSFVSSPFDEINQPESIKLVGSVFRPQVYVAGDYDSVTAV
jgi:hypothetical protein